MGSKPKRMDRPLCVCLAHTAIQRAGSSSSAAAAAAASQAKPPASHSFIAEEGAPTEPPALGVGLFASANDLRALTVRNQLPCRWACFMITRLASEARPTERSLRSIVRALLLDRGYCYSQKASPKRAAAIRTAASRGVQTTQESASVRLRTGIISINATSPPTWTALRVDCHQRGVGSVLDTANLLLCTSTAALRRWPAVRPL